MDYLPVRSKSFEFRVSGLMALFSDPIMRTGGEKCSYPVPTYEALKGIAKSIYWKPTFVWHIDEVRVMNPVRMQSRSVRPTHYQDDKNDLSYYAYLQDCVYQVRCHFEWNENRSEFVSDRDFVKHSEIFVRSLEKGGRQAVFLGTSECGAVAEPCVYGSGAGYYDDLDEADFGFMLHGFGYPDEGYSDETRGRLTQRFWHCKMRRGVVRFPRPEECPALYDFGEGTIKNFGAVGGEDS